MRRGDGSSPLEIAGRRSNPEKDSGRGVKSPETNGELRCKFDLMCGRFTLTKETRPSVAEAMAGKEVAARWGGARQRPLDKLGVTDGKNDAATSERRPHQRPQAGTLAPPTTRNGPRLASGAAADYELTLLSKGDST